MKECSICGQKYPKLTQAQLKIHQRECKNRAQEETETHFLFHCDQCNGNFDSQPQFDQHKLICNDNLVCKHCSKSFLPHQIRTHSTHEKLCGAKSFMCQICNKSRLTFYNVKVLKLHQEKCRKLVCEKCGLRFAHKQSHKNHVERRVCEPRIIKYQCGKCMHSFKYKKTLKKHKFECCKKKLDFYTCQFCLRIFSNKGALATHHKACVRFQSYEPVAVPSPQSSISSIDSPQASPHAPATATSDNYQGMN